MRSAEAIVVGAACLKAVGPVVGERIACIFYLRGGLLAETATTSTARYQAECGVKL